MMHSMKHILQLCASTLNKYTELGLSSSMVILSHMRELFQ